MKYMIGKTQEFDSFGFVCESGHHFLQEMAKGNIKVSTLYCLFWPWPQGNRLAAIERAIGRNG